MAESEQEFYFFKKRDEVETKRLNEQHDLIIASCGGNLLHPSVPQSELKTIADVGAGTGAWLRDVRQKFPDAQLTGFDISDVQFPADEPEIKWVVHDILKPFPAEYHGRFDLVQVRYMVVALKADAHKTAIDNVSALLKPQGYFQWVEFDIGDLEHYPKSDRLTEMMDQMINVSKVTGTSTAPSKIVNEIFISRGFRDIFYEDYNSFKHRELDNLAQENGRFSWGNGAILSLLATGEAKNQEEAVKMRDDGWRDMEELYQRGTVPKLPTKMIVGIKPE